MGVGCLQRCAMLCVAIVLLSASMPAAAVQLNISCGAVGIELELCRAGAAEWARNTGNEVRVIATPNSSSERLALYQQWLASESQDVDVYQIDVIWPGLLARHFIDLRPYSHGAERGHFPAIIENNTVDGKLIAMPLYVDVALLYYRSDLLARHHRSVPQTWEELAATAALIQDAERRAGKTRMWGYVFQARAYEGLTCNALEWLASSGGGTFIDPEGRITVDNAAAIDALRQATGWIGTIAPQGVLNYAEEEARGVFQAGQAVFMRNWPYAWALLQGPDSPVADRVGVAALPHGSAAGDRSRSTLGGWQLAVARYSRHPELAADLVLYMTSAAQQKRRAIEGAYNPTRPALYADAQILAAQPFIGRLRDVVSAAISRPSRITGWQYNRVSVAIANAFHRSLSGREAPAQSLQDLAGKLRRMKRRGWR